MVSTRWIVLLQDVTACAESSLSADLAGALDSMGLVDAVFDEEHLFALFDCDFKPDELEISLKQVIREYCGLRARFSLLKLADFQQVVCENPFAGDGLNQPEIVYVLFLKKSPAETTTSQLESLKAPDEKWSLSESALYLVTPSGFTASRLAREAQPALGVGAVVRNWAEVQQTLAAIKAR